MLIIKPIQNKDDQKKECLECEIEYDPNALAYEARVDDILVGVSQFHMKGGIGHMIDLKPAIGTDDRDALFIMGRQTMNFINLAGCREAYFEGEIDDAFALRLGFLKDENGKRWVNLEGFFDEPCKHKKQDTE